MLFIVTQIQKVIILKYRFAAIADQLKFDKFGDKSASDEQDLESAKG
jgi:hypothetical protein